MLTHLEGFPFVNFLVNQLPVNWGNLPGWVSLNTYLYLRIVTCAALLRSHKLFHNTPLSAMLALCSNWLLGSWSFPCKVNRCNLCNDRCCAATLTTALRVKVRNIALYLLWLAHGCTFPRINGSLRRMTCMFLGLKKSWSLCLDTKNAILDDIQHVWNVHIYTNMILNQVDLRVKA